MQEQHEAIQARTRTVGNNTNPSASWPLLAAGFLSQACPSAAPLFHSCAMFVSLPNLRKSRRGHHDASAE